MARRRAERIAGREDMAMRIAVDRIVSSIDASEEKRMYFAVRPVIARRCVPSVAAFLFRDVIFLAVQIGGARKSEIGCDAGQEVRRRGSHG